MELPDFQHVSVAISLTAAEGETGEDADPST